jgi:hypothetical protein
MPGCFKPKKLNFNLYLSKTLLGRVWLLFWNIKNRDSGYKNVSRIVLNG